jgi:hypothetical protein
MQVKAASFPFPLISSHSKVELKQLAPWAAVE